jgi:hypothetical protein
MNKIFIILLLFGSLSGWAQSSMRRCTLLPITDSVGGAVGFKLFEEVEAELKKSQWCTYVSNSGMMSVFTRYRENLPKFLKTKEVIQTVAEKLKVGSIIRISLVHEVNGIEIMMEINGENGEDLLFSEKAILNSDDVDILASTVKNWLDVYSKMIPYDAKINGILGEQITLDVGKGYPMQTGQRFIVKRLVAKKKHPLLKKIVDWETEPLAEGKIFNISDNQALGMVKVYKSDKKLIAGDWVRLEEWREEDKEDKKFAEEKAEQPGSLGILSLALFDSSASLDNTTPGGSRRMTGNMLGVDVKLEGWITRNYFAAIELTRSLGTLKKSSGTATTSKVDATSSAFKLLGGYKYLPIGFFYGPQIDFFGGYANYSTDLNYSNADGFGKSSISGILIGTAVNVPLNREFRFFAQAEILPFPSFKDDDGNFKSAKSVSAMELEIGMKYQINVRTTADFSLETLSRKAKFNSSYKELSYQDNRLKVGASFNF